MTVMSHTGTLNQDSGRAPVPDPIQQAVQTCRLTTATLQALTDRLQTYLESKTSSA